ncbi:MAG TPA: signal peptidase I [Clostridiaceae bacterium]|nr:signal peptidase I [Clostridiaceae bacterium]
MKLVKEILDWTCHILIAFVMALVIVVFVIQPTQVEGQSMEPTLHDKDRIIINKLSHHLKKDINYGDIVIIDSRIDRKRTLKDDIIDALKYNLITYKLFDNSYESRIYWVKRVIAKEGDVLDYKDNNLYLNGILMEENYVKDLMMYFPEGKIKVPEGHVFVMGDNRNNSTDSRHIGFIPIDHIVGTLFIKF